MEQIGEQGDFDPQRGLHFKGAHKILMRNLRKSGTFQTVLQNMYIRYLETINGRHEGIGHLNKAGHGQQNHTPSFKLIESWVI